MKRSSTLGSHIVISSPKTRDLHAQAREAWKWAMFQALHGKKQAVPLHTSPSYGSRLQERQAEA